MKKINVKKLNQFYMSGNNAPELKRLVESAIESYLSETPNATSILVLTDLGLLVSI
jgi:hypothetical protein